MRNNLLKFVEKVPPQIAPFNFGEEQFNLDEMVSATCTVNKGDLPIHVWWTLSDEYDRAERNLTTNDGIVLTRNNQRISMLSIEAVKARHRGNYTCFAKNNGGLVQHSAYLSINGDLCSTY